jgi:hypothetical protein
LYVRPWQQNIPGTGQVARSIKELVVTDEKT